MANTEDNGARQDDQKFAKIEAYDQPAGGWGALLSVARNLKRQEVLKKAQLHCSTSTNRQALTVQVVRGQKRKMPMLLTSVKMAPKPWPLKPPQNVFDLNFLQAIP